MANAVIDSDTIGLTELVAAPASAGQFIRVHGYVITSDSATVTEFFSGDTFSLSGPIYATNGDNGGGAVAPYNPEGWFDCRVNEALKINSSVAEPIGGHVHYTIRS